MKGMSEEFGFFNRQGLWRGGLQDHVEFAKFED